MAGFGGFNEKKKKKQKRGNAPTNTSFSSKPVFTMPQVIKRDKKGE